ncbi:hypothetical protein L1987_61792 [Smallanthus sonchifolius]|uniref:Uncharacterized protein n=1 Tax=Smallanthus sonchifolius TaxID=185202 RepID=A0ACB9C8R8_9ASTR|nr:hypothetical protein L1987_61792 [Smallanthus sonchifolius]
MIESLHTSVAMYKKLYEEEHKRHVPQLQSSDPSPVDRRNNVPLLLEASHNSSSKKAQEKAYERIKFLEEEITGLRSEIITLRSQRDTLTLESAFSHEKLDRFMKDFERQREEMNGVIARNVEFSQLIIDYQRKIREASESLHIAEDLSHKLNMEVTVLKREKEILINSEKRAFEEVRSMSERVHQLQATLNTIQSAEEDWAEAKKELQKERDNVRQLTLEHESAMRGSMQRIEEMGKELANALRAVAAANTRASAAEERLSQFEKMKSSEVNEVALKEMEIRHEQFKSEAEKVKKSLEDEVLSLKEHFNQLQYGYNSKEKEAASAAVSQEQALASSLSEIFKLREEVSAKMLHIEGLESQLLAMKDDSEKEHQRWRIAQDNYERQVILQSETIQELTKTSQELVLNKEKVSELQKVSDILKTENDELKSKWETEKLVLEESKDKAEKKFNETNEQNKILHDQLEALHIKLAEKSQGLGSGAHSSDDGGLQNVVKYLRRSKEIAETKISLVKQEKLRLQSQLEAAMKAESEDEFKALQIEVENLNDLLVERQSELEACKREIEMQKKNLKNLDTKVKGLLDIFKDMDPEDYVRMRADFKLVNVNLSEKDGQLEEIKKFVSEKQEVIIRLEQDLERSKVELHERESKINNVVQTESSLKTEVEKQKRSVLQLKRMCGNLVKEKDELLKKNQELSKELVDCNQVKRSNVDSLGEQAEKDARIQMLEKTVKKESIEREEKNTQIHILEKTVDRLREEVKKGKEVRIENEKNQKTDKGICEEKLKLADDLEKHKQALKTLSEEIKKMKHESDLFVYLATTCHRVVENFEQVANQPRTLARRLGLPRIVKPEQPKGDVDMSDAIDATVQSSVRKRPSASEGPEGSNVRDISVADVAPPQVKKSRGSEQAHEGSDAPESITEESPVNVVDESQTMKEDDTGNEEIETGEELAVEVQTELQNDRSDNTGEANVNKTETEVSEDHPKITEVEHTQLQQITGEGGDDPEEGNVFSDAITENQIRSPSPLPAEDEINEETLGEMEVSSPLLTMDDNEDKKGEEGEIEVEETTPESSTDLFNNDGNDEAGSMAVESVAAAVIAPPVPEKPSNTSAMAERAPVVGNEDNSVVSGVSTSVGSTEVKPEEPVDMGLTTINLNARGRLRSLQRLAGSQNSPTTRGRRGVPRGRTHGGRTGRGGGGETPGSQGM